MCTICTNSWAGVVLINCHSAASSLPVLPLPQSQITKMGFTMHKCKLRSLDFYVNDQMLFYLGINGCDGYHHCIMIPVLFSPSFRAESTPSKNLQIGNFWLLLWPPLPPPTPDVDENFPFNFCWGIPINWWLDFEGIHDLRWNGKPGKDASWNFKSNKIFTSSFFSQNCVFVSLKLQVPFSACQTPRFWTFSAEKPHLIEKLGTKASSVIHRSNSPLCSLFFLWKQWPEFQTELKWEGW